MADEIINLEPKRLWYYFNEICKFPRSSGHEEAIRKYIVSVGEKLKLKCKTDPVGNIVISKEGKNKNGKTLVFQCHIDMVCESAPNSGRDLTKDPILPKVEGEWVTTGGKTTLGSDNGIGIAACLALLEDNNIAHGPIECLFTTCEETGMDGAFGLDKEMVTGRTMINLDSEEEGVMCVGCAGGCNSTVDFPISHKALPKDYIGLSIRINGLKGGHSGINIVEQRGNAIKLLARVLYGAHKSGKVLLCDIQGGTRRNVIPSLAEAVIAIKKVERAKIVGTIEDLEGKIAAELKSIEPTFKLTVKDVEVHESIVQKHSDKLIAFLNSAPCGVIRMSYDIPGLVQTSTNLAVIKKENETIQILFLSRSSSKSDLDATKSSISACAELAGVEAVHEGEYPGWQPNLQSEILSQVTKVYKSLFNKDSTHAAVHAGLECGIIGEKFPGMDMVSFGPDIQGAHSVNEKVRIKSVENFWNLIVKSTENFAKGA